MFSRHDKLKSSGDRMNYQGNKAHIGKTCDRLSTKRKSQSYTDISTQISGSSSQKWRDYQTERRMNKPKRSNSRVDYAFLREILGIKPKMGSKRPCDEGFLNEELKEAVLKLRTQVKDLKLDIKDKNWLKTLEDLGDIDEMEMELLEGLYMLRNAYKRGVFSSSQCLEVSMCLVHCFSTC